MLEFWSSYSNKDSKKDSSKCLWFPYQSEELDCRIKSESKNDNPHN